MKSALMFLGVFLLAVTFSCCPAKDPRAVVRKIDDATVMLVDEQGRMHCAGIWIAQDRVLTAGHCVQFLGMTDGEILAHVMIRTLHDSCVEDDGDDCPDVPKLDPMGKTAWWKIRTDPEGAPTRHGVLVAYDDRVDLALLKIKTAIPHGVATLRRDPLEAGDEVLVVGHPQNRPWSFTHGFVSDPAATFDEKPGAWLQLDTTIHPGNSGGGAFDRDGLLVGIASFAAVDDGGLGWFVSQSTIREFLAQ